MARYNAIALKFIKIIKQHRNVIVDALIKNLKKKGKFKMVTNKNQKSVQSGQRRRNPRQNQNNNNKNQSQAEAIKEILVDTTNIEETRVAVVDKGSLEDFEVEATTKTQNKGNIYLAKVIRIEPSLQAAFVEYGGVKHGFLPFTEIHPDYYQLPVKDKEALIKAMHDDNSDLDDEEDVEEIKVDEKALSNNRENSKYRNHNHYKNKIRQDDNTVEVFSEEDEHAELSFSELRRDLISQYKIQEVIKPNQLVLVQVEKEERGNKGAALTTYISLAGRFCVLMPNSGKRMRFGISRKIVYREERNRLKSVLRTLDIPLGQTLIVRTAGTDKTKKEIKKDYDYMMSLWNEIREKTVVSTAPSLVYEEYDLLKKVVRDMISDSIDNVIIEGDNGFEKASEFAKEIGVDSKKILKHKDSTPLFLIKDVERQLEDIYSANVVMPSGGYLVINQTEALVAIDVNSGKATRERDIEETALRTNLEAVETVARQLRLRDMAGLVVIDFIDMLNPGNNANVEQKMREALRKDRSKVQMSRLNSFGLMILSRQRLKPSFLEVGYRQCPHCLGLGIVPNVQTASIRILRKVEEELINQKSDRLFVSTPSDVALYLLNQKRSDLENLEEKYSTSIIINGDDTLLNENVYTIERLAMNKEVGLYLREKNAVNTKRKDDVEKQYNKTLIKEFNSKQPKSSKSSAVQDNKKKGWFW
jgi:ribonuclease E